MVPDTFSHSLVQFDYQAYLLPGAGTEQEGRTPGVLSALVGASRVTFGAKDFWQNFPSELEIGDEGFTFYNWPKRNPPARFERPVARDDAFRNRFVHEGEVLDFRLPEEYTVGEIWQESSSREGHWAEDRPETANAQGIARTEEMFLYFTEASLSAGDAAKVIRGLNDETLRAVVDPAWMCASGVFGDIHPYDPETYPEEERIHALALTAPGRWVERLGFYGMWLHGDYPGWNIDLARRTASTYRTLRKNHKAFPYRWRPFARSGDPRLLKLAQTAARQMADANFCHYATAEVDASVGPHHFRRQGWWDRSLVPWAGRSGPHLRSYTVDCDYLWDAYYMTGYGRARDVALLFGKLTRHDYVAPNPRRMWTRITQSMMPSYLDMYQATFEPWFLASAHEIADLHVHLYGDLEQVAPFTPYPDDAGHTWRNADQQLYRFSGDDVHRRLALNNAIAWSSPLARGAGRGGGWGGDYPRSTAAFAWAETGDDFYLARLAASLDMLKLYVYEGDVEYLRGTKPPIFHGRVPFGCTLGWGGLGAALAALERAGHRPEPVHGPFLLSGSRIPGDEGFYTFRLPPIHLRKQGPAAVPLFLDAAGRSRDGVWPEPPCGPYAYEITGPSDTAPMQGTWRAPEVVKLPAGAPNGVYRLDITGRLPYPDHEHLLRHWGNDLGSARSRFERRHNSISFPVGKPDTPEVMVFPCAAGGTNVDAPGQGFWFAVPAGVREFWIEFRRTGAGRAPVNRVSVWDPDGRRAWDRSYSGPAPPRATIAVPTEHAGKLWRATGGDFVIDPQIPPYFSVSRTKWFNPEK